MKTKPCRISTTLARSIRLLADSADTRGALLSFCIACAEAMLPIFEAAGDGDPAPRRALSSGKGRAGGEALAADRLLDACVASEVSAMKFSAADPARHAARAMAQCARAAAYMDQADELYLSAGAAILSVRQAVHCRSSGSAHERLELLRWLEGEPDVESWLARRLSVAAAPFSNCFPSGDFAMDDVRETLFRLRPDLHARLTDPRVGAREDSLSDEEIDDLVDFWHGNAGESSLQGFLGWTAAEYSAWALDPGLVPGREGTNDPAVVAEKTARAARSIRDGLAEARGFSVRFRPAVASPPRISTAHG